MFGSKNASQVEEFFRKYARNKKDRQGEAYTHTFYTGGSFIVKKRFAHENERQIEEAMFEAIVNDYKCADGPKPMFINEIASSPTFRMFFDWDVYHTDRLTDTEIAEFVDVVYRCVRRFYPENTEIMNPRQFEVLVCDSPCAPLCEQVEQLRNLCTPRGHFQNGDVVLVLSGRVARRQQIDAETWFDVVWTSDVVARDGLYDCDVGRDDDCVLLKTPDSSTPASFGNPVVEDPRLTKAKRPGAVPNAIDVRLELERTSAASYTSDITFRLSDHEHFLNAKRDERGLLKHGLHMIMPQLFVDVEKALFFRVAVVHELEQLFGKKYAPTSEGFNAVVDAAVYGSGRGLRMILSRKSVDCPLVYDLHSAYVGGRRDQTTEVDLRRNLAKRVKRCSIRTTESITSGWAQYEKCLQIGKMLQTQVRKNSSETVTKVTSNRPVFAERRKNAQDITDPAYAALFQTFIHKRWPNIYDKLRVTGVRRTSKGVYFIAIAGEGQHWCLNKNPPGDHTSNTIYFQCDPMGVCVRCHSPKVTDGDKCRKCPCKDFHSAHKSLNKEDKLFLFPHLKIAAAVPSGAATASSSSGADRPCKVARP